MVTFIAKNDADGQRFKEEIERELQKREGCASP